MPKTLTKPDIHVHRLKVPKALYEELERVAASRQGADVDEILRSFIQLGLEVMKSATQGGTIVLRHGEKEREMFLL